MNSFFYRLKKIFLLFPIPITVIIGIMIFIFAPHFIKPLGIVFFILTPLIFSSRRRMQKKHKTDNISSEPEPVLNKDNNHYMLIKSCEEILLKIKNLIKKQKLNIDLKKIYTGLNKELNSVKGLLKKIDFINDTLEDPFWDTNKINERIEAEKLKEPHNTKRIDKLIDMIKHIEKLKERRTRYLNRITDLEINFKTIYTKITLLDNEDYKTSDEIETEIQKILDFQLKVNEYEEKLDDELKDY